ncbi:MAG: cellobiose transport system substrate-binding protein [Mycobacteriales bacterium]|jgi:cellobiose transport system substrate-binding protein
MYTVRRRTRALLGALVVGTLAIAGCSSNDSNSGGGGGGTNANAPVTLNVRLFGTFGYKEAGLFDAYHTLHPNVTINFSSIEQEQNYYPVLQQNLNAGKGTWDVAGIEVGRIADVTQRLSAKFVDLKTLGAGSEESNFYPWKWKAAQTADGKVMGLGTDVGPIAIAYRTDLFKQAGLPTDRDELAKQWSSWDSFIAMGEKYKAKMGTKSAFIDTSSGFYNTILGGSVKQYYDESGTPIYDSNPDVKKAWDTAVSAIQKGLTGKVKQFDDAWNKGFSSGAFATVGAPSWMIGYIKGQAGDAGSGKWDIAPGPNSANWGGSYLGIPKNSQHAQEAYNLIQWLTAAPQQITLFKKGGNFPSSSVAAADPAVSGYTEPYFNNAPTGKIFGDVAAKLPVQVLGPKDATIKDTVSNGLLSIETQGKSPDDAWSTTLKNIKNAIG